MKNNYDLIELLSSKEHQRWAKWQKYLHSCCIENQDGSLTIPKDKVDRWTRQIKTDYENLSEKEKEHAAKAIECGYLYRDGDMLYTKILVNALSDRDRLFDISNALQNGYFDADAEIVAAKVAELIKKSVPDYLFGEWRLANNLASMPILDAVVECLIEKGVLTPPEDGIGAEGCWMSVEK